MQSMTVSMARHFHHFSSLGIKKASCKKADSNLAKDRPPENSAPSSSHKFQLLTPSNCVLANSNFGQRAHDHHTAEPHAPGDNIQDHHNMKKHAVGQLTSDLHASVGNAEGEGKALTPMTVDDMAGHGAAGDFRPCHDNARGLLTPQCSSPCLRSTLPLTTSTSYRSYPVVPVHKQGGQ